MRLLLSYGASTTSGKEPFIFDAIDAMDIDIIPSMVQAGADCNISLVLDKEDKHTRRLPSSRSTHRISAADIIYLSIYSQQKIQHQRLSSQNDPNHKLLTTGRC